MSTTIAPEVTTPDTVEEVRAPISWKFPIVFALATLLSAFFAIKADGEATFVWKGKVPDPDGGNLVVDSSTTIWILTAVIAVLTAYAFFRAIKRQTIPAWLGIIILLGTVLAFLTFAGGGSGRFITLAFLGSATLIKALPLIYGALAGVICERVGVVNIAIEGQLLVGAFAGVTVASATQNPWLGLLGAILAGAIIGLILAFVAIKYAVDQIIVGVVLNVLCLGLTSFFLGTWIKDNPDWNTIQFALPTWKIPVLGDIPFIGPVFFQHTILVYFMYFGVAALTFMLFRSRWGLRLRAVGEHPKAADTVGIKVNKTRFINTVFGGAVAGLGGAAFTIGAATVFTENISAGQGYIALAAMILGKWHPVGALGAALMFGLATAIVGFLPNVGSTIDPSLLAMIPYIVTILAVAGFVGKSRAPAAENIPYIK